MTTDQEIRTALVNVQDAEIESILEFLAERVELRTQDQGKTFSNFTRLTFRHACNDLRERLGMPARGV